jgi:uridine kinase
VIVGRSLIVGIDGLDGSGKSRLATALADALIATGHPTELLHVDDFRRPLDFDGLDAPAETALYYHHYFDFAALTQAVRERMPGDAGAVTIVEGVMLLRASWPAEAWLVLLEVSPEEARSRIQLRDQAKGRSPEEVARRIDRRYFPAHARYRREHDPAARAHAVIDNEDWRHPRLVRCAPDLPPPLAGALAAVLGAGA